MAKNRFGPSAPPSLPISTPLTPHQHPHHYPLSIPTAPHQHPHPGSALGSLGCSEHGLLGVGASGPSCLPDRSHLGKQQPGDLWQVPFSRPGGAHHPTTSPGPRLSFPHLLPQPECPQKAGVGTTYDFHMSGRWKCPPFVFSHCFSSLLLK